MDAWLTKARDGLAAETNADPSLLALSDTDTDIVLELARIAAHESGARTNAPLLCYLVGRAQKDRDLSELADAVRRSTS